LPDGTPPACFTTHRRRASSHACSLSLSLSLSLSRSVGSLHLLPDRRRDLAHLGAAPGRGRGRGRRKSGARGGVDGTTATGGRARGRHNSWGRRVISAPCSMALHCLGSAPETGMRGQGSVLEIVYFGSNHRNCFTKGSKYQKAPGRGSSLLHRLGDCH
jgi:hypothetical protein